MIRNATLVTPKHRAPGFFSLSPLSRAVPVLVCLWLVGGLTPLVAQIERQHGAHVHGEGVGTLALDDQTLSLSLEMPGFNVVGFEHPPTTQAQKAEIDSALTIFNTGQWLNLDPEGRCVVSKTSATAEGYDAPGSADEGHGHADDHTHNHDHNNDHNHSHDHGGEHAYFNISVEAVCSAIEDLAWVELNVFASFPNNERITVDVLTATSAQQARLSANSTRIELE